VTIVRRLGRYLAITGAVLLILLAVGPFLIPLPVLPTVAPVTLADSDSQFVTINGLETHTRTGGRGSPDLVLLHGFGASLFSWRELFTDSSPLGRLYAFDRPAFGLTERQLPGPYSPEDQVALTIKLMDHWGIEKAVLVGNSAGGTIAVRTAMEHPERVSGLILVSPAIYTGGGSPAFMRPFLRLPQVERIGLYVIRRLLNQGDSLIAAAWHDPSRLTAEVIEGYGRPLRADNWDRALWAFTLASKEFSDQESLSSLIVPTLVVTGDDDRVVPTKDSIRLSQEMPNATLAVIPECGHLAHEECPAAFLEVARQFIEVNRLGAQ